MRAYLAERQAEMKAKYKGEMNMNQAQEALEQAASSPEGNYEQHLTNRILRTIEKYPNITQGKLQNKLGYVLTPTFELVMDRLIQSGQVVLKPVKFELSVAGREGQ